MEVRAFRLCPYCWSPMELEASRCENCGPITSRDFFGPPGPPPEPAEPLPQRTKSIRPSTQEYSVAFALLLMLGMFGLHRLFLGHVSSGVLQFMLGLIAVGAVIVGTPVLLMPAGMWLLSDLYLLTGGYLPRQQML